MKSDTDFSRQIKCYKINLLSKMFLKKFLLLLIMKNVLCDEKKSSLNDLLESYEVKLNTSLQLDKQDRALINTWKEDVQVKLVNVTTEHRLQMTRHKEHSFRKKYNNLKWQVCLNNQVNRIADVEQTYYKDEKTCLKATTLVHEKNIAVEQIEKEIRKWRKSYRYLKNLCSTQYPEDKEEADRCLVDYMQKDNYDQTFERLLLIKLDTMKDLFRHMHATVIDLEECLKTQLSKYLEGVRNIMSLLEKCYSVKDMVKM